MNNFIKYPSTPHLIQQNNIRLEKVLDENEKRHFLSQCLVVEEKVDGANLGISFDDDGNILAQNRGNYLSEPYTGQWKHLKTWLYKNSNQLFDLLANNLIIFGEWCFAQHSVYYNKLPDWFLAFDIYDKEEQRFYSANRRTQLLEQTNIYEVPFIAMGTFTLTELFGLINGSALGQSNSEGVYLRFDNEKWLVQRAKLVREEFVQAIDIHWSNKKILPNKLIPK